MPHSVLEPSWDRAGIEPCWNEAGSDVFVLGSGFSIAASMALYETERFPDTAQLGLRVVAALDPEVKREAAEAGWPAEVDGGGPTSVGEGAQFEAWLARLGEDQPYLSTEENLRRRALYTTIVRIMRPVLVQCEERVVAELPSWLPDLVSVWHDRRAQVVTFNYDTLVERCLDQLELADGSSERRICAGDVLDGIPPSGNNSQLLTGLGTDTFRLVKLHGSTSWFWVPGDLAGTTVLRFDPAGDAGECDPSVQAERARLLLGRDPFIVPPISTKAALYTNPVTRELWTRARRALREARRVFLIGYSLPPVDTAATGLIADALAGRSDVRVEVVNPKSGQVVERIRQVGVTVSPSACHDGANDAVVRFVAGYVRESAQHVVRHLRSWQPEQRKGTVRVAWGSPLRPSYLSDVATEVDATRGVLVVRCVNNAHTDLNEFLNALADVGEIVLAGDPDRRVVAWVPMAQLKVAGSPPSVYGWSVYLLPAGPPPRELAPMAYVPPDLMKG